MDWKESNGTPTIVTRKMYLLLPKSTIVNCTYTSPMPHHSGRVLLRNPEKFIYLRVFQGNSSRTWKRSHTSLWSYEWHKRRYMAKVYDVRMISIYSNQFQELTKAHEGIKLVGWK